MLNNKTIAVVVPAYNEETQILHVIETMPEFVDRIIVINDCSKDKTAEIVKKAIDQDTKQTIVIKKLNNIISENKFNRASLLVQDLKKLENKYFSEKEIYNQKPEEDRIILINHLKNSGKGAGIATGYQWAKEHNIDCVASMDGDGQMDPEELESICKPIVYENVDYAKGNRLIHRSALLIIPKLRFLGNAILSILTKIASGYWHVSDTQTGYTAISNKALNSIRIYDIYKSYGYPNDMLVKLNIAYCTVKEVEIKPVYNVGEKSKMKIYKVLPKISWLLLKSFFKRLWSKYLFRDFHPLFILYHFGIILILASIPFAIKIIDVWLIEQKPLNIVTFLAFVFLFISGFQSLLFAMWMDIQNNEKLYKGF